MYSVEPRKFICCVWKSCRETVIMFEYDFEWCVGYDFRWDDCGFFQPFSITGRGGKNPYVTEHPARSRATQKYHWTIVIIGNTIVNLWVLQTWSKIFCGIIGPMQHPRMFKSVRVVSFLGRWSTFTFFVGVILACSCCTGIFVISYNLFLKDFYLFL
jgi:hypothetical protein